MRAVPALLFIALVAPAAEAPIPTLPPEPRSLQLTPGGAPEANRAVDAAALGKDIEALRRSIKRVQEALGERPGSAPVVATPPAAGGHEAAAVQRSSERFGDNLKTVGEGLEARITASIDHEPAELVLKELIAITGAGWDDVPVPALRRTVSLRLASVAMPDVLDRMLGQIGLTWREEGQGAARRIVVIEGALGGDDAEAASVRALERAAAAGDGPVSAEALYLLGARDLKAHRPIEAMRRFNTLVETLSGNRDPVVRRWVQRGVRAIADCMSELGQWQDARSVYRNYIARSDDETDPDLPRVYLSAAEAGRRLGLERKDPVAFDEAADDLHAMLERFGTNQDLPEVPIARLMIGGLLYDQKRWREAETQLRLYTEAAGGKASDQVAFWQASCAFQLNRFADARRGFEELTRMFESGHRDGQAPESIYEQAAYHVGLCHMRNQPPQYVHALFAFQRAQVAFPKSGLTAELTVAIARCYAEIEREDDAVEQLVGLLKGDGAADAAAAQARLEDLVGSLLGKLSDYPGPVRSRVMFYIGQATSRRADRTPAEKTVLASQAVGWYERTLQEEPANELRDAARVGLARAAFQAGDSGRGELELRKILQDPTVGERDRAYAGRLLGDWHRQQGRLPEAIKAYKGEVE